MFYSTTPGNPNLLCQHIRLKISWNEPSLNLFHLCPILHTHHVGIGHNKELIHAQQDGMYYKGMLFRPSSIKPTCSKVIEICRMMWEMKRIEDNTHRWGFPLTVFAHLGYCEERKRKGALFVILGFLRHVNDICTLLGLYAEYSAKSVPAFRYILSVPSSRVKKSLKIGPIGCTETSLRHSLSTVH